jgi:threonylcarbamoyladenosine tRNA methylthiotransferase MtaB
MPSVALHTVGCKLNYAETSTIGKQFLDQGFELVEFGQQADVCVINTCTVTERADRECRQLIRRALRTSAQPYVIVMGCYAQIEPERIAAIGGVDLVLGAREKFRLFDHAGGFRKNGAPRVCVSPIGAADDFGPAHSTVAGDRTRAFLKVQDGCDYTCSYCTIPMARGVSRSQPIERCVEQARVLVAGGFKEIVLTGVNVGDYGRKTGGSLLALLEALATVDGLIRLRISSIEPNLLSDPIIELVASHPVLCRHLHIPLQSGDDMVLGGMRRRYRSDQYAELIGRVRERIPLCGIGADVIVGFPGETAGRFEETYRFLTDLPVSYLHVFTYSERPGTDAAAAGAKVDPHERSRRNSVLRVLSEKKRRAFHETLLGTTADVLLEDAVEDGRRYGLTDSYCRVGVRAEGTAGNEMHAVRIDGIDGDRCFGAVVEGGR